MGDSFIAHSGGRHHCYSFFEDLMQCVKKEGVDKVLYKCHEKREDYFECMLGNKKGLCYFPLPKLIQVEENSK